MIKICLCYAPEDNQLRQELEKHLKVLERQKFIIAVWSSHDISAGSEWRLEAKRQLDTAHIILLLLSVDFLASDDFYYREVMRAIQRHERGEARVIPILLRSVHWYETPLGRLRALPDNGKFVTDKSWQNINEALLSVVEGIRKIVEELSPRYSTSVTAISQHRANPEEEPPLPVKDNGNFRVVQTLVDHLGPVACITFARNEETLVSDSWDHTIKYWNLRTGARRTLMRHSGPIYGIALSNANRWLGSGGDDRTIQLWHFHPETPLASLEGHSGSISSVVFSPDDSMLVSGSDDCTLRIWDTATKELMVTLKGHLGPVSSVAFSPDGTKLVSGSYDNTLKIWDTATKELMVTLKGHLGPVFSVAFSPDGTKLVSGSYDNTLKIWDLYTNRERQTLVGHLGPVSSVTFSPDGKTLISGSYDKTIREWDHHTGQALAVHRGHSEAVLCVAFHPMGKIFASGGLDKTIKIWERQPDSLNTARDLDDQAKVYENLGRYMEAEPLVERALLIREHLLGAQHLDTVRSMSHLSLLYNKQGKHEQAKLFLERAVIITEQLLGAKHPDAQTMRKNYIDLLRKNEHGRKKWSWRGFLNIFSR